MSCSYAGTSLCLGSDCHSYERCQGSGDWEDARTYLRNTSESPRSTFLDSQVTKDECANSQPRVRRPIKYRPTE